MCALTKLSFEPPVIYCTSCGAKIKRGQIFYSTPADHGNDLKAGSISNRCMLGCQVLAASQDCSRVWCCCAVFLLSANASSAKPSNRYPTTPVLVSALLVSSASALPHLPHTNCTVLQV